jgi:hypothetical protein
MIAHQHHTFEGSPNKHEVFCGFKIYIYQTLHAWSTSSPGAERAVLHSIQKQSQSGKVTVIWKQNHMNSVLQLLRVSFFAAGCVLDRHYGGF